MKEKNKIHNTILSLLDVRRYDGEIQAFQKEDSTYFDLLQISGRDLNALQDEDVWYDIRVYTMLYRTCLLYTSRAAMKYAAVEVAGDRTKGSIFSNTLSQPVSYTHLAAGNLDSRFVFC